MRSEPALSYLKSAPDHVVEIDDITRVDSWMFALSIRCDAAPVPNAKEKILRERHPIQTQIQFRFFLVFYVVVDNR